jgi:hypothetical protein
MLTAAQVDNQGTASVFQAGRDVQLATLVTRNSVNVVQDAQNYTRFDQATEAD